jgi:hypothetical protein
MLGHHYPLLTGVAGLPVITAIAGYYSNAMGLPLLPFLAVIGAFPSALNGGLGWCGSATAGGRFRVA